MKRERSESEIDVSNRRKRVKSTETLETMFENNKIDQIQALYWKLCKTKTKRLEKLLKLNAETPLIDLDMKNKDDMNGLNIAIKRGRLAIVQLLVNYCKVDKSMLENAVLLDNTVIAHILLQTLESKKTTSLVGKVLALARSKFIPQALDPLLVVAVQRGNAKIVQMLLLSPMFNAVGKDSLGLSLFHHAIKSNRPEVIEIVMNRCAVQDEVYKCFRDACVDGNVSLVQMLLPRTSINQSLMAECRQIGHESILSLL
jgi:hypothetical protein